MPRLTYMVLALLALIMAPLALNAWQEKFPAPLPAVITTAHGNRIALDLEIAATPEARERGLMQRQRLAPYDGMVFFFPTPAPQRFWMKDTPLPLDMLFVDEMGRIVYIHTATPLSLEPIGPSTPVRSVIEIAAGRASTENITVGNTVTYDATGLRNLSIR